MTNLLTPQEVLQALIDGKDIQYRFYDDEVATDNEWEYFYMGSTPVSWLLDGDHQFRLAQEMIKIGDVSFPKPYQGEIQIGQHYYIPKLIKESGYEPLIWEDIVFDKMCMANNMLHLTKENAIAHAKALIKLSGGQYE